jgi:hypothetical protein
MDEFIDAYVHQTPLFVHGPADRASYLLGPNTLNDIVAQAVHTEGRVAVTLEEKLVPRDQYSLKETPPRIDPTALKQLLVRGASLIINEIDDIVPAIGDLAQSLEWNFGSNVWVNAYGSFGRGGAFRVHFDSQDVIALQIAGSKRWALYGNDRTGPSVNPTRNEILRAGSVAFVPRGVWHHAEVVDSPSIHLTISIAGISGSDFIRRAFRQLSNDPIFSRSLPRVAGKEAVNELVEVMKTALRAWVENLSVEPFLLEEDGARRLRARPVLWGHEVLSPNTQLRLALRRLPKWTCDPHKPRLRATALKLGGKPLELSPDAIELLAAFSEHPVIELASLIAIEPISRLPGSAVQSAISELLEKGIIYLSRSD